MESPHDQHTEGLRAQRRKSVWLAVLTSLFSKGGNLLVMAIAFPLAHEVLGDGRFGLFGILQSVLFIVGMTDFGIGAGLTRRLTGALSFQRVDEQRTLFSTGFFVILGCAVACLVVASVLFSVVPLPVLFGDVVRGHEAEFSTALWLCLGMFLSLFLLGPFARWRDAAQQTYTYLRLGALGNFAALGLLWMGVKHFHQLWWMVFSLYVPQIIALGVNAVALLKNTPPSVPQWPAVDKTVGKSLLKEGLSLFIILTVAPTLLREGMRWILSHETDALTLTRFTILVQLGFYGWGFFIMLSQPLTPALMDAVARRDYGWVKGVYKKSILLLLAGVVLCPVISGLVGPTFVRLWMGADVTLDARTMAGYGVLFSSVLWSGVHGMFYGATGCLRRGAMLMGVESVLGIVAAYFGIQQAGIFGGVLAAGCFCLLVTGSLHFWLLRRHFNYLTARQA